MVLFILDKTCEGFQLKLVSGICSGLELILAYLPYGSFPLLKTYSGMDSDSDSKPDGYIGLYRNFSHCTDSDWIPTPYFCRGQESESKSVPKFVSGNVNEP